MLIDPPSVTGLPPGQLSVVPLSRARGRRIVYILAGVALALSAFAGVAVALTPPHRPPSFPYLTLVTPFPSVTPGAQPRPTASPHVTMPAQNDMTHPSTMPAMARTVTPSPTMTTGSAASPSMPAGPTVTVTYRAISDSGDDLVGEVMVTNSGYSAISGWQIVVALPHDQFTAVSDNARGYASHHVLLLHPASDADSVAVGGTLSVFFTAYGTQATPELCAFNDITCE
jgi:hypothetical protein